MFRRPLTSGVLGIVLTAVTGTPLLVSAAPSPVVVESRDGSEVPYRPPVEVEQPAMGGMEMQYQLQLLQQEVMELRGTVEELRYELRRMKSVQDERYLELDSRLQQAMQGNTHPATEPPSKPVMTPGGSETPATDGLSDKALYETTQQLIRNRQYDLAVTQLESLINRFPDSEYTPNAYYWLGQVYAAKPDPDFERARQALAQVIGYFPDHAKVPDATFALGKVYHTLGDCQRAKKLLEEVVRQYPGKSAAKLAENYLRESVDCAP